MKKLIPLILTAALTLAACASASDETPLTTPTPAPEAPEPVSYTHLDVYKRQR